MGETETLPYYYYPLFGWDNLGVTATPSPGASWFAFTKIGVDEMSDTLIKLCGMWERTATFLPG